MHATHLDPRNALTTALTLLALGVLAVVIPAQLADTDLRFGGGSKAASSAVEATAPAATPSWIADPLASPLAPLGGDR
jgi:hypothetical protein